MIEAKRKYFQENYLFKESERVDESEITGEYNVLTSSLIETAFLKILNDYVPKHNKVIFSLCTETRPYLKSKKWSMYNKCFGKDCDLIVCSNGGIIPLEYQLCYPFPVYDAPHTEKYTPLYNEIFKRRLKMFINKFDKYWEKKCFVFLPNSRNYRSIQEMDLSNSCLLLDSDDLKKIQNKEDLYIGIGRRRQPLTSHLCLKRIEEYLDISSDYLKELTQKYTQTSNIPMKELMFKTRDSLILNQGYTYSQLVSEIKQISNIYSNLYINKSVRANTINLPTPEKLPEHNLFYYKKGLFYKYHDSLMDFLKLGGNYERKN